MNPGKQTVNSTPSSAPLGFGTAGSTTVQWGQSLHKRWATGIPPGWFYPGLTEGRCEKKEKKAPSTVVCETARSTEQRPCSSPKWMQQAKLWAGIQTPKSPVKDHKWLGFPSQFEVFHIHPKLQILFVTLSNNVTALQNIPYVWWNDACTALETTAAEWHSGFEFKIFSLK